MQEKLLFSSTLDITNLTMRYKTIRKPFLEFLVTQHFFIIALSTPSSLDLKIGIACTGLNGLSENRCEIKEI